jgi:hypothetical protein
MHATKVLLWRAWAAWSVTIVRSITLFSFSFSFGSTGIGVMRGVHNSQTPSYLHAEPLSKGDEGHGGRSWSLEGMGRMSSLEGAVKFARVRGMRDSAARSMKMLIRAWRQGWMRLTHGRN